VAFRIHNCAGAGDDFDVPLSGWREWIEARLPGLLPKILEVLPLMRKRILELPQLDVAIHVHGYHGTFFQDVGSYAALGSDVLFRIVDHLIRSYSPQVPWRLSPSRPGGLPIF